MKHNKIFSIILGLVVLSAGCGSQQAQKQVTLTFWDPFLNTQDVQPLLDAYRAAHPNVTIIYSKKDINTYSGDLLNALASGSGPDIFSINNSWLPQYLDKIASSSNFSYTDFKNAFVDTAVSDFTKDRVVYGVPLWVDSLALYYNKDLLGSAGIATPPKTWDELAKDANLIKKQDRSGYFTVSGAALGTNGNINRAVDILYLMMLQSGTQPYSSDSSFPTFNQSVSSGGGSVNPGQQALSFYTSFADPRSANYNWNYKSDYSLDAFANGRVAFLYSYSYARQTIVSKSPNLNFDVASVPQFSLNQNSVNYSNYWGEVVSKQGKNAAYAWDFLKFISGKDSLDKFYAQTKLPSSRRDLIELQIPDPDIGVFANANLTSKQFYKPDQQKLDDIFGKSIDNVILSGMTAADSLSQAVQQAGAIGNTFGQ